MACIPGHTQVVELLLKHGANVNVTNKQKVRDINMLILIILIY